MTKEEHSMRMTKYRILPALGVVAILSACAEGQEPNNRVTGSIAGALAGAAAGAAIADNDQRGAIIGGILGGIAGGAYGDFLDQQEAELRRDLEGSGVGIENTGQELIVTLPNAITFAVDSTTVRPAFRSDLVQISQSLIDYPNSIVEITGHTDSDGSTAYNQDLSERRAIAVADIIAANGVPTSRMRVFGGGEQFPVATNETEAGKAQNRRVEIVTTPQG
jgi:outer membrane protein OmpA-like peptidoglycan-associated protein